MEKEPPINLELNSSSSAAYIGLVLSVLISPILKTKQAYLNVIKALSFMLKVLEGAPLRFTENISDQELEAVKQEGVKIAIEQMTLSLKDEDNDTTLN